MTVLKSIKIANTGVVKLLKDIAVLLVLFPLLIYVLLYFMQEHLLFQNQGVNKQLHDYLAMKYPQAERVITTADGTKLHGWCVFNKSVEPAPVIIFFGGNADNVGYYISDKDKIPQMAFCGFNYRGYDLSGGKPAEQSLVDDALLIYDTIVQESVIDPERVILMGRSLGTGVAVQLAAQRKIHKLVLISPYDSMVKVAQDAYPWAPVDFLLKHRFESFKYVGEITAETLCVIATEDRVVSVQRSEALLPFFKVKPEVFRIKGFGHNDLFQSADYWPKLKQFVTF